MNTRESVVELITLAEQCLESSKENAVDEFVAKTGEYLDLLSKWQEAMNSHNPLVEDESLSEEQRASFRQQIERLSELHQELLSKAGSTKEDIGSKMSEVHKRATGLRKYIDSAPSRITIAGKRKG